MNESYLKVALVICVVAILALVWVNYVDLGRNNDDYPNVNDGLTALEEFDLAYDELGSSVRGTVFVMRGDKTLNIKIVADVIVGEEDIGGVEFLFTPELKVTDILCSFNGDVTREHVGIWVTGGTDNEYKSRVEVGRDWITRQPDPGQGTVLLDLQLSRYVALDETDSLYFMISVGGKDNVLGVVYEKITIPLLNKNAP